MDDIIFSGDGPGYEIINLLAGTYIITIIDANGCTVEIEVVLTEPQPLSLEILSVDEPQLCELTPTSIVLSVSGGISPYQIYLNGIFETQGDAGDFTIYYECTDTFVIEVIDAEENSVEETISLENEGVYCSYPNLTLNSGDVIPITPGGTYYINGDFVIESGTFVFSDVNFYFTSLTSKLIIKETAKTKFINCLFSSCSDYWQGIRVVSNSFQNTFIFFN